MQIYALASHLKNNIKYFWNAKLLFNIAIILFLQYFKNISHTLEIQQLMKLWKANVVLLKIRNMSSGHGRRLWNEIMVRLMILSQIYHQN